jgi:hypothetical protein
LIEKLKVKNTENTQTRINAYGIYPKEIQSEGPTVFSISPIPKHPFQFGRHLKSLIHPFPQFRRSLFCQGIANG